MIEGLWYVCASAGFIMIVGSLILISKRIIMLDTQTKEVITEIRLPFNIRLKTNLPTIIMLSLGVLLLVFPIWQANEREKTQSQERADARARNLRRIVLKGPIEYPEPIKVYVIASQKAEVLREVSLEVPLSQCTYTVAYYCGNGARKLDDEEVILKGDESDAPYSLRGFRGNPQTTDPICEFPTVRREADVSSFKDTATPSR